MSDFIALTVSLFSIVNPFAALPVYVGITGGMPEPARRALPRSTALAVLVILAVAYLAGQGLLAFFSIRIASLRIAGGILIFGMAWSMLQARVSGAKQTPEEAREAPDRAHVAVVPLAMPLLAGPGAISVMILQATRGDGVIALIGALAAAFLVSGSVWLILRAARPVSSFLGQTGMNVATRFMGLILAAIAVEFIAGGLSDIFPAWASRP